MDVILESIHADWTGKGRITWLLSDIPQDIEESLVTLLAIASADDFAVSSERMQRLLLKKEESEQKLFSYDELPHYNLGEPEYY